MTTSYELRGAQEFNIEEATLVTWVLAAGESGQPFVLPGYADRSVQMFGEFGGATVVFEATNEPDEDTADNYNTLTDPQGNALSSAVAMLEAVSEMTRVVRPRVVGGDVSTAVTIILFAKR